MDEITKSKAINKTDSMKRYISFPDALFDKKRIDDLYANVSTNYLDTTRLYIISYFEVILLMLHLFSKRALAFELGYLSEKLG